MIGIRGRVYLLSPNKVNALDGLRLEFNDSWMLIRASGTEPVIRIVAESRSRPQTKELIRQGTYIVQGVVKEVSE